MVLGGGRVIVTPKTLAQSGGWFETATDNATIPLGYRNAVWTGITGSLVLPLVQGYNDEPLVALGHEVWVHNLASGATVTVIPGASGGLPLLADESMLFVLVGYDTGRQGIWQVSWSGKANGQGLAVPSGFRIDIVIPYRMNNLNCLREAVDAGYDGSTSALVTVSLASNLVLGSESKDLASFDTGGDVAIDGVNWADGTKIYWRNDGRTQGYGGRGGSGGIGGTGAAGGVAGEDGGPAVRAAIDLLITNNGLIIGGSGGGGGGDGRTSVPGLHGGGGGGGAGCRVLPGGAVVGGDPGSAGTNAQPGQPGTLLSGGRGGLGSQVGTEYGGPGGDGGDDTPTSGQDGRQFSTTPTGGAASSSGTSGSAGAATSRASAATLTFVETGIIQGSQIVVG